ncbi:beta strand repeat-containing protein [Kordiimonas lipolytica]|uniref:Beta strand repeat-containing protein n=1 Tax=Kordiimonas lipolytica TaxID=1662421 RepID=A0ABV8U8C6_9PROT|nr:VCBS domain-containing protein [Kordiimonas lipolytica]
MATLTVNTTTNDSYDGGDLAAETADGTGLSFKEALGLAQDGDTITFDGSLSGSSIVEATSYFITTDITIDGDLDNDGTPDITLDANNYTTTSAGVYFIDITNATVTLDGLTFTGTGDSTSIYDSGTTILWAENSTVSIVNSVITDTVSTRIGTGLYFTNSNTTIESTRFENTIAPGFTVQVTGGTFTMTDSSMSGNSHNALALVAGATATISNSVFAHNGRVGVHLYDSSATISNSIFTGNDSEIFLRDGGIVTISNSIITGAGLEAYRLSTTHSVTFSGANVQSQAPSLDPNLIYSGAEPTVEADLSNIFAGVTGTGGTLSLVTTASGAQIYSALVNPTGVAQGLGPQFAPVIAGDTSGSITENIASTTGTLTISDNNGAADESFNNDTITGSYGELTIAANGDWTYALDNADNTVDALSGSDTLQDTITVHSADGTAQDITVTINGANDAPAFSGVPADLTVTEDTAGDLDLSAVSFSDAEGDSLTVTLSVDAGSFSVPADGAGVGVTETLVNGQTITLAGTAADIATYLDTISNIQYTGAPDAEGDNAAMLTITPNDGVLDGTAATSNINITGINDAPTATDNSITMNEDTAHLFAAGDFNFSDVDTGAALASVRIDTLTVSSGTLQLSGVDINPGDVVAIADISAGNLVYTPATNAYGADLLTFTFSVNDGTTFAAAPSAIDIDVTNVEEVRIIDDPMSIRGGSGDETLTGGNSGDTLRGGDGDDSVSGNEGDDVIWAGRGDSGNDRLAGGAGADTIGGGGGNDFIEGSDGSDLLYGGQGDDTIYATSHNNENGDLSTNIAWGGPGNDLLLGGLGNDTLGGGVGSDTVNGGAGDDVIWASAGDDMLSGGAGADTFIFVATSGDDVITDFDLGEDTLNLTFAGTGFTSVASVQAAATAVNGGILIDLGDAGSVFLEGLDAADLTDMTILL